MIDPGQPPAQVCDGVPATDQEVSGVEGEVDVADLEEAVDLLRGLDVGAGVVVERGLQAARPDPAGHPGEPVGEPVPAGVVEREAGPTAGVGLAPGVAGVGEGRPGRGVRDEVGDGDHLVERIVGHGEGRLEVLLGPGEREVDPAAGEAETIAPQAVTQLRAAAQQPRLAQVDPGVAGVVDELRETLAVGQRGEIRSRETEHPVAHRRVCEVDHSSPFPLGRGLPPRRSSITGRGAQRFHAVVAHVNNFIRPDIRRWRDTGRQGKVCCPTAPARSDIGGSQVPDPKSHPVSDGDDARTGPLDRDRARRRTQRLPRPPVGQPPGRCTPSQRRRSTTTNSAEWVKSGRAAAIYERGWSDRRYRHLPHVERKVCRNDVVQAQQRREWRTGW